MFKRFFVEDKITLFCLGTIKLYWWLGDTEDQGISIQGIDLGILAVPVSAPKFQEFVTDASVDMFSFWLPIVSWQFAASYLYWII